MPSNKLWLAFLFYFFCARHLGTQNIHELMSLLFRMNREHIKKIVFAVSNQTNKLLLEWNARNIFLFILMMLNEERKMQLILFIKYEIRKRSV